MVPVFLIQHINKATRNTFFWLLFITMIAMIIIWVEILSWHNQKPEDQRSCKHSPDIWASYKHITHKSYIKMAKQTLTLIIHNSSFTSLTKFQVTGCNNFQRNHHCHIFPCKSLSCKILSCRKIDQGQSRVIICTNNKGLRSLMLHTKFYQNLPSGSWKEGGFLAHLSRRLTVSL